jgi:DNA-binding LacI/PurR family transcriptional regulator
MNLNHKFRWQHIAYCLINDLIQKPRKLLPGIRVLGKQYKVSTLTIKLTLNYLEELGVIEPAQPGKKRQINLSKLKKIAALQNRAENHVVFLSAIGFHNHFMQTVYETLHELCNQKNLFLSHHEILPKLSEIRLQIATIRPRALILYALLEHIPDTVSFLNIPTVGIETASSHFPVFNTSYSPLLIRAFQQAREAGHHRISAIMWNPEILFYESLATKLENSLAGEEYSFSRRYNLPLFHGETAVDYQAKLKNLFRYTPPSCIILWDLSHYLAASSFFLREGLRIPDDISVILLSQNPLFCNIVPSVAHFALNPYDVANQIFHTLQKQMDGLESHEQTNLIPTWIPGDSLKILSP